MTNTTIELQRRAAAAGPGYLGLRSSMTAQARDHLASEFRNAGEEPPAYLTASQDWVEREAKLFEAGEYPDKGVAISPADLQAMQSRFDLPVPVLIEHSSSPLELGFLTAVRAEGEELFGTISLTPEADALIRRSGAKSLSLGLSPDLKEIREVSLVQNPRISSAQLFRSGHLLGTLDIRSHTQKLVSDGRLLPGQAPIAEALLECPRSVAFEGSMRPVQQLVLELLDRMPKLQLYGALVPAGPAPSSLPSEEQAFYERYFPGLKPEEIARRKSG